MGNWGGLPDPLQQRVIRQKLIAAGIGAGEIALPFAGGWALGATVAPTVTGGNWAADAASAVVSGFEKAIGWAAGGAAGAEASGVAQFFQDTNPVTRWRKANAVRRIVEAAQGKNQNVADLDRFVSLLKRSLAYTDPASVADNTDAQKTDGGYTARRGDLPGTGTSYNTGAIN